MAYARNLFRQAFTCFLSVGSLASVSNAQAEWEVQTISADKKVVIYADTASLKREGDFVFAWIIYNRSAAAPDGAVSSKALNQYDCTQYRARAWQQSFFDAPMGTGRRLPPRGRSTCETGESSDITMQAQCESPWLPIQRGTTGEDLLRALCVF
jgi:hypothetical protein